MDIEKDTCLMDIMVCKSGDDTREFFLEGIEVPKHIQEGDRVDVRIRYGNAEEYIVLSDKVILSCESEIGITICLTETEFLMISSAISDTELYRKTMLYIVEYPEYVNMKKSPVTYMANKDVLLLLGREKTEGESRAALEQRLQQKEQ